MKKLFSFIFSWFVAVFYFTPLVSAAYPLGDHEHCFFTLRWRPSIHLSLPSDNDGSAAYGGDEGHSWFTALPLGGRKYVLRVGHRSQWSPPLFSPVLDEDRRSGRIAAWKYGSADHQMWIFEDTPYGHPFFRIRNVATGRYLTYDPGSNGVWGYQWCATDNQIWQKH